MNSQHVVDRRVRTTQRFLVIEIRLAPQTHEYVCYRVRVCLVETALHAAVNLGREQLFSGRKDVGLAIRVRIDRARWLLDETLA